MLRFRHGGDNQRSVLTLALQSALALLVLGYVDGRLARAEEKSATEVVELEPLTVEGRQTDLIGIAESASEGATGRKQLDKRPMLRPGEIMETVPGLIATQHSGSGKANQFFLRGFNLDHGTDFATSVDGVPINLPTHAHGQGYLDLNFLIPELIDTVKYKKGPYYAEVGDFASAGAAQTQLVETLPRGIAKLQAGEYDFYRGLLADSTHLGEGDLLYAGQARFYDGPWANPEDAEKFSGLIKYTAGDHRRGYSLSAWGYYNDWTATDQIPRRAVASGQVGRFGTLDPTDGGRTARYTLNAQWWKTNAEGTRTQANVYAAYYRLNLFSNFTFFLNNPNRGDQFEQSDRRLYTGGRLSREWPIHWLDQPGTLKLGTNWRHDQIFEVGLFDTDDRMRFETTRKDEVAQTRLGLYAEHRMQWLDKLRTKLALRGDFFRFDVNSRRPANAGNEIDAIASPKFSLALGPWYDTEYYLNLGLGYHSNDARGTTIAVDPESGAPVAQVEPLVRSRGAEIGARTQVIPGLQSTLALWYLALDSELVFVGDAGGTEASRASRRLGLEWTNFYQPTDWLTLNLDVALTDAEFSEGAPGTREIPNSIGRVISAGVNLGRQLGWFGSLRARHFGERPLVEDGSVESQATTIVNLKGGYGWHRFKLELDVLNLFDAEDPDVSFFYASRLPGEPASGVKDVHFSPFLPRTVRLSATWRF